MVWTVGMLDQPLIPTDVGKFGFGNPETSVSVIPSPGIPPKSSYPIVPPPATTVLPTPSAPKPTPSLLRVPKPGPDTSATQPATPLRVLAPNTAVRFTTDTKLPKEDGSPALTYAEATGLAGICRRKQQHKLKKAIKTAKPPTPLR